MYSEDDIAACLLIGGMDKIDPLFGPPWCLSIIPPLQHQPQSYPGPFSPTAIIPNNTTHHPPPPNSHLPPSAIHHPPYQTPHCPIPPLLPPGRHVRYCTHPSTQNIPPSQSPPLSAKCYALLHPTKEHGLKDLLHLSLCRSRRSLSPRLISDAQSVGR